METRSGAEKPLPDEVTAMIARLSRDASAAEAMALAREIRDRFTKSFAVVVVRSSANAGSFKILARDRSKVPLRTQCLLHAQDQVVESSDRKFAERQRWVAARDYAERLELIITVMKLLVVFTFLLYIGWLSRDLTSSFFLMLLVSLVLHAFGVKLMQQTRDEVATLFTAAKRASKRWRDENIVKKL
jgi:hypothetical protein